MTDLQQENESLKAEIARLEAIIAKQQKEVDFLDALRAVGVDNWEGYSEAQELLENGDE